MLRMRHQPEDVARRVGDACDVADRAVRILARPVAKEDPPLRVELLDELRLPEPAAVAVLDRDPERLQLGTATGEWADRTFDPKVTSRQTNVSEWF